MKFKP